MLTAVRVRSEWPHYVDSGYFSSLPVQTEVVTEETRVAELSAHLNIPRNVSKLASAFWDELKRTGLPQFQVMMNYFILCRQTVMNTLLKRQLYFLDMLKCYI